MGKKWVRGKDIVYAYQLKLQRQASTTDESSENRVKEQDVRHLHFQQLITCSK